MFRFFAILIFSLLAISSATTFRSVNLYGDADCTESFDPRSTGATSSFTQWINLPSSSITNITNQKCVVNPLPGTEIGSAHYVCQQSTDSVTRTKLQMVFISEYSNSDCNSTAINFYSMVANSSSTTATFPLCLKTQYFNSRNRTDFYAKIECANADTTFIVNSNSIDGPALSITKSEEIDEKNGGEISFHLSYSAILLAVIFNLLAFNF